MDFCLLKRFSIAPASSEGCKAHPHIHWHRNNSLGFLAPPPPLDIEKVRIRSLFADFVVSHNHRGSHAADIGGGEAIWARPWHEFRTRDQINRFGRPLTIGLATLDCTRIYRKSYLQTQACPRWHKWGGIDERTSEQQTLWTLSFHASLNFNQRNICEWWEKNFQRRNENMPQSLLFIFSSLSILVSFVIFLRRVEKFLHALLSHNRESA